MALSSETLEAALETLGELLADRGDIVAVVSAGRYVSAKPLPDALRSAVRDVAAARALIDDWLNPGPTSLRDSDYRQVLSSA
jgi:hypothetical protein